MAVLNQPIAPKPAIPQPVAPPPGIPPEYAETPVPMHINWDKLFDPDSLEAHRNPDGVTNTSPLWEYIRNIPNDLGKRDRVGLFTSDQWGSLFQTTTAPVTGFGEQVGDRIQDVSTNITQGIGNVTESFGDRVDNLGKYAAIAAVGIGAIAVLAILKGRV